VTIGTSDVSAALAEAWAWVAADLEPHHAGMNSRTWLVDGEAGRFVAKVVPPEQHDRFVAGLAVAGLVESSGLPAGRPVPTRDGRSWVRIGGHTLALLAFVEGHPLVGDEADERRLIGSTLARAHRALAGREVPGATHFHWIDPAAAHLDVEDWVRPAILDALADWGQLPPESLTWGLLHTDPAPEAFLVDPDSETCGLIDWDTGLVGPLMYDVASAVMYLGGPYRSMAFLEAYIGERVLDRVEVEHTLEPMLRLRWAVQADYFARRIAADDLTGITSPDENLAGLEDARRGLAR